MPTWTFKELLVAVIIPPVHNDYVGIPSFLFLHHCSVCKQSPSMKVKQKVGLYIKRKVTLKNTHLFWIILA